MSCSRIFTNNDLFYFFLCVTLIVGIVSVFAIYNTIGVLTEWMSYKTKTVVEYGQTDQFTCYQGIFDKTSKCYYSDISPLTPEEYTPIYFIYSCLVVGLTGFFGYIAIKIKSDNHKQQKSEEVAS